MKIEQRGIGDEGAKKEYIRRTGNHGDENNTFDVENATRILNYTHLVPDDYQC